MTEPPSPGSDSAIALGCTCPVLDNSYGAGDGRGNFWVSVRCPVHTAMNMPAAPFEAYTPKEPEA